jgi:hypothetical protein
MPQILLRTHHERRLAIVVKRAQSEQVRAVPLQLDPLCFYQAPQGNFLLQPLYLIIRNTRHQNRSANREQIGLPPRIICVIY